jgi:hypothetical protein
MDNIQVKFVLTISFQKTKFCLQNNNSNLACASLIPYSGWNEMKYEKKSSSKIVSLTPSIFWHGHFILMLANYFEGVIAPFDFKYFIKKFVCTTPTF